MDEQERRDVDKACCILLGAARVEWRDGAWWEMAPDAAEGWIRWKRLPSPSTDPALVVPLWNALLARGYCVEMEGCANGFHGNCRVTVFRYDEAGSRSGSMTEWAGTLQAALATVAARAVGTEP